MPKVGSKKFKYDAPGMARARAEANRTGKPMQDDSQSYQGGVKPVNPNADAVNSFMNREALNNLNNPMSGNKDIARLQKGLNTLNKVNPNYTPLKSDGKYGPKTQATARSFFGTGDRPQAPRRTQRTNKRY